MTSWRNSASDLAQADLDGLLNSLLPFARRNFEKLGEFFPVWSLRHDRRRSPSCSLPMRWQERPDSPSIISMLLTEAQNKRGELRAVGICSDVRATGSDAIKVDLEHSGRDGSRGAPPLHQDAFGRGIEYSALQAGVATNQIWTV